MPSGSTARLARDFPSSSASAKKGEPSGNVTRAARRFSSLSSSDRRAEPSGNDPRLARSFPRLSTTRNSRASNRSARTTFPASSALAPFPVNSHSITAPPANEPNNVTNTNAVYCFRVNILHSPPPGITHAPATHKVQPHTCRQTPCPARRHAASETQNEAIPPSPPSVRR